MSGKEANKDRAVRFLEMIVAGKVTEAYDEFVAPGFRHHNPFFKGDANSLLTAMAESNALFPSRRLDVQRALQDDDLVAVHSRLRLGAENPEMAVVHIMRFADDRIAEFWDVSQTSPNPLVNENGMF